jgi:DNA-binding transcriptional ArsR family regulator
MDVSTPAQRKALASPLRQEILSHFAGTKALAVADLAERMGRPATALYYHVSQLHDLGFLETAGERRKGKRYETLFRPTAQRFEMPAARESEWTDAVEALTVAQRMAIRDMKGALESGRMRDEGDDRNCIAFRLQGQVELKTLLAVNEHIDAILELIGGGCGEPAAADASEFISLTLALMPLQGRSTRSPS